MSNPQSGSAQVAAPALPPHAQVVQMATGLQVARAVYALAELGVADHFAGGPRSAEELAEATGAHAPSLYRLLRFTAALGYFVEGADRTFTLAPLGDALRSDAPGHARSTVRMLAGPVGMGALGDVVHSVRTGEAGVEKAFGMSLFDYLAGEPEQAAYFNEAMIGFHGMEPPAVAAAYDFSDIGVLVDVGGGTGNLLTTILNANPRMRGVLYDMPHVAAEARRAVEAKGLAGRCDVAEGSFFDAVPDGGDAYVLSHIIHDWDEERCLRILANCRAAMRGRGRLLLVEMVIPPGNDFHLSKLTDFTMLVFTPGGQERTEGEYAELFAKAGFRLTRVVPTDSAVSVVEAVPEP